MHQISPNIGLVPLLHRMIADGIRYHLFDNDVTPDQDTILTDLTEATFPGYAPFVLVSSDYQDIGVVNNNGLVMGPPAIFTNTGGSDIPVYGYYLTDSLDTDLLAVGRFDGAPQTVFASDNFYITTLLADFSKFLT